MVKIGISAILMSGFVELFYNNLENIHATFALGIHEFCDLSELRNYVKVNAVKVISKIEQDVYKMLYRERILRKIIKNVEKCININPQFIKRVENIRGLYKYPSKMLGRKMNEEFPQKSTDVLVFAAHPDDDVLGLSSTLYRHSLNGENIKVIFVTNGTGDQGDSWYLSEKTSNNKANLRYLEALQALSQINIPQENIYCLGFPDGGTQRYLREISNDVSEIIKYLQPRQIYVHCIEGGHIDHDMTSFAVKSACHQLDYDEVYEWAEYNSTSQLIGSKKVSFPSSEENSEKGEMVNISEEERILKRRMLSCHKSQNVEQYYMMGEAVRKANTSNCVQELYDHGLLAEAQLKTILQEFSQSCSIAQCSNYSSSLQQKSLV